MTGTANSLPKLEIAQAVVAASSRDFLFFCKWLKTRDEATGAIRPWPDYEYVKVTSRVLQREKILWIPKSRRTFMSWEKCAYLLWRALFDEVFLGVWQSRVEDESSDFLENKIKFLYESLPYWFKAVLFPQSEPKFTALKHTYPNKNQIKGVAQGPHVARGKTPSVVVVDECAFHPEFRETLTALVPLSEKNAQLIFVSSVGPGAFWSVVSSKPAEPKELLLEGNDTLPEKYRHGIQGWRLNSGGYVLRVHFSADPEKTPEWLEDAHKRFPGGLDGPEFRREMMIEADAFSGEKVYPHFVNGYPHVYEFEPPPNARKWLSVDYGVRNPTCAIAVYEIGENELGPIYGVRKEFYKSGLSINDLKAAFHMEFGPSDDSWVRELIDPSTDAVRETETKTQFFLFRNGPCARHFVKADNSAEGRVLISELLHNNRLIFHPECKNLIFECENYQHDDWSEKASEKHNPKEKVIKKDDHAMDALKYWANAVRYEQVIYEQEKQEEENYIDAVLERMDIENDPLRESFANADMTSHGLMNDF